MSTVPDHFKHCGYLAYWLRRRNPAALWEEIKGEYKIDPAEKEFRKILYDCGRAFTPFRSVIGSAVFFEQNKKSRGGLPREADADYLKTAACYMKYKSVSPRATGLIYRPLFWV